MRWINKYFTKGAFANLDEVESASVVSAFSCGWEQANPAKSRKLK
jgi:hypothetical protein